MRTWVWPKQYAPLLGAGVQRWVHFMRNVLAPVPVGVRPARYGRHRMVVF